MSCDQTAQVHAYYDGELSQRDRAAFETHVHACAECRDLLADLRRMSDLITTAPLAEMTPQALARLQDTWGAVRDRGVMRIAGWLTAAAAAVLIGALLVWPGARREEGLRAASAWPAAIMPPAEAHDGDIASAELVGVAQWMANDLSSEQTR